MNCAALKLVRVARTAVWRVAARTHASLLAVVIFVLLQAVLPSLHGMQHVVRGSNQGVANTAASYGIVADEGAHVCDGNEQTPSRSDDQDDCDECRTIAMAKAFGGTLVAPDSLFTGEIVCLRDVFAAGRGEGDPLALPRDSRGPPVF